MEYISVSRIGTFMRCELQYYLSYVQGIKIPPNGAMVTGSGTHKGIQRIYEDKKESGRFNLNECKDIAADYVRTVDCDWTYAQEKYDSIDKAVAFVTGYGVSEHPDNVRQEDIVGVENKLEIKFSHSGTGEFLLMGYPDLILKDKVIDFKTSSRKVSAPTVMHRFQLSAYSLYLENIKPHLQAMWYMKKAKTALCADYPVKTFRKKELTEILVNFWNRLNDPHTRFIPSGFNHPWACDYCGYRDRGMCPYFS